MAADSDGEPNVGFTTRVTCSAHISGLRVKNEVRQLPGICEEDNDLIHTVFTCHGNLEDPDFPQRFSHLLDQLSTILSTGKDVLMQRVKKVEPWNSVRVTLTIPREAAARLRALAAAGDAALQALGILSVQLEGDQVISLRLAAQYGGEPQEIVLRTGGAASEPVAVSSADATTTINVGPMSTLLQSVPGTSGNSSSGFRSPNVVAPAASAVIPPSPRPHSGPSPFPFTSMTHAAQTQQARQDSPHHNFTAPPPYAAKSFTPPIQRPVQSPATATNSVVTAKTAANVDTTVSLASPLLVNLLQTDGKESKDGAEPRQRVPTPSKPRPRPITKPFSPRTGPRFPLPTRFPPPATTTVPHVAPSGPILRPAFTPSKEGAPARSVLQGYSQFTASSSKPCTSTETKEESEMNNTADGKKLIINPLTGELEPMPSESSDSEGEVKSDPFFSLSSCSSRAHSDEDSLVTRRMEVSDHSDSEHSAKANGADARRRMGMHKPGSALTTNHHAPEKIKLRFMVDKPEPGSAPASGYKVDLSFSPSIRKAITSCGNRATGATTGGSVVTNATTTSVASPGSGSAVEEPRVPPLHISLRGRNATVVSNKKKPIWLMDDEDLYSKLPRKKVKLGAGSAKDGRDCVAITNCDLVQTQKPKRAKIKRLLGGTDGEGLKLKIPVPSDMDVTDLCDEKLSKKRKDSKKIKNNVRHSDSDGDVKVSLKMDSEEWISRTLKEETLRHSVPLPGDVDGEVPVSESVVGSGVGVASERARIPPVEEIKHSPPNPELARTSAFKPGNLELSELLRCKKVENSNKKLDCLKIKNKLFSESVQLNEAEECVEEITAVKKPQEIGGKIKSELSSKIDRVSGKLKNDLSKDGISKKKLEDTGSKGIKGGVRTKSGKKEGAARLVGSLSVEGEGDDLAFSRAKRRHSGDQSAPESQAQKVKRSSSSDQPSPISKLPVANRRFDALTRKIRKDYVIDRLRKDKLGKLTPLNAKLSPGGDLNNKKLHGNRAVSSNGAVKSVDVAATAQALTVLPALVDVKPVLTRLDGDPEKLKDSTGVEGNTQGEDSGIESMDALSEKSPNQGESPCRKDEGGKEMDDGKKGQNHDRTDEERKDLHDNSCLTMGNSNQETHQPQAHSVPFECSSQNNNSAEPEPETSTKLNEPANDGLIDSFEIKIREAFRRDEDPSREGLAAKILEGSSDWGKKPTVKTEEEQDPPDVSESAKEASTDMPSQDALTEVGKEWTKEGSPSLEDMERFRVNPPLYTYAKREDSLSPSPTTVECSELRNHVKDDDTSSRSGTSQLGKTEDVTDETLADSAVPGRCLRNKSLLEQLLIEIPEDTRRTRSWHKLGNSPGETPKSSPRPGSPNVARPSPRSASKQSPTPRTSKRPSKRKCSENAAELIKACMGVDEVKTGKSATPVTWKKGDVESSDDEPLSDLARSREHSIEQDAKPNMLKTKLKQIVEDESRNNNKVGVKVVADTPTRRSVRQTQGGVGKALRAVSLADVRTVRSTRSALCQETCETGNKRRRTSRDGK